MICVFHCLTSLNMITSRSIHAAANGIISFFKTEKYPTKGFPVGSVVKTPPANAGTSRDTGSIPRLGRSPREGNGNPLQYSCLEYPMDRGAWWATVHEVTKSQI